MEAYATVLTYAIPGFVLLIIIESVVGRWMGVQVNIGMDTVSSLSSGMTNTLKSLMGLTVIILSYGWMVKHFAIFQLDSTAPWVFVLAFIGHDFAGYWSHRWNHHVNVFWNRHIVHHSSEEFNLACALRQQISVFISIYFFLYIPMAILGIPEIVVAITAPIHLFAQFWYHTKLINKMGVLEYIIVTPSHHRVHHAINPEYVDKNFSEIFIIWDKLFGTFQEELEDVPPVYGTLKPVRTWNPILINFMHVWQLAKDAWRTRNWWDKIRLWFMPTGWRPEDVKEKYPIHSVQDVYQRPKYDPSTSKTLQGWTWFQLIFHNALIYYILSNISEFNITDVFLYAAFLMISIFAYTTLMDGHRFALPAEVAKLIFGVFLIFKMGGWFGMDSLFTGATNLMIAYMVLSTLVTIYFIYFEPKEIKEEMVPELAE